MKTELITTLMIVFGVFLFVGVASASDAETLQPAATITYNEDVDVNGTLYANSAYIGETGVGGVTFFNGSIVNVGATTPVTIADDLRVDGEIFRTEKGGTNPIKISDHIIPTLTNTNNFGTRNNYWKSGYFKQSWAERAEVTSIGFWGNVLGQFPEVRGEIVSNPNYLSVVTYNNELNLESMDVVNIQAPKLHLKKVQDSNKPACILSREGDIYYNTTTNHFYGCNGSTWNQLD